MNSPDARLLPKGLPTGMTSRHLSETGEHFTPPDIVESARFALGSIDLDPASCPEANEVVRAKRYFAREDNGFRREWPGRVFLNPPGGLSDNLERDVRPNCRVTGSCGLPRGKKDKPGHAHEGVQPNQKKWWFKLASEWWSGKASSAVFVMFSVELLQNTQNETPSAPRAEEGDGGGSLALLLPIPLDFAFCIPRSRLHYGTPGGGVGDSPPHASGIVLLSDDRETTRRFVDAFSGHGRVTLGPTALRALGR